MSTAVYHEMAMRLEHDIVAKEKELADLRAARAGLQPLLDTASAASSSPVLSLAGPGSRRGRGHVVDAEVIENGSSMPAAAQSSEATPTATKGSKGKKPAKRRQPISSGLPRTGDEFWRKLMGKGKHTIPELVAKASAKLEVGEDAAPALKNRVNSWLYPKVASNDVAEVGVKGNHKQFQLQPPSDPAA